MRCKEIATSDTSLPSLASENNFFTFELGWSGIEEVKEGSNLGLRALKPNSQEGFGFVFATLGLEAHAADVVHASLVHHSHWENAPRLSCWPWLQVGGLTKTGKPLTDVTRPSGICDSFASSTTVTLPV